MDRISNHTELAVIFRREKRKIGPTLFFAYAVVPGKLDHQNMIFIDQNGNKYSHLFEQEADYGFAMRTTVGRLNRYYKKKTLSSLCKSYLKELQLDFYYYIASDNTYKDLAFITEDSKYHTTYVLYDRDLEKVILRRTLSAEKEIPEIEPKATIDTKLLIHDIENKVIGQNEAIEDIVSILWQNSKSSKKSNMMIVGPAGVGKTEIIREITKKLHIPMVIIDTSSLTQSGFTGSSVEDALKRLLYVCDNDVKKAEEGIIVLDEIDKIADNQNIEGMIATTGVQYELLKLLEDGIFYLNVGNSMFAKNVRLDASKITIIGLGAFSQMKEIKKRTGIKLGFGRSDENKIKTPKITTDDFIQYGLIPELVGRFQNIIELSDLNKEHLIQIMKNPHDDILNEKLRILAAENIQVQITESVYEKLADRAIQKKIGARGLTSEVNSLFRKAMVEISQNSDVYQELIIDERTVDNPKIYTLVKRK